MKSDRITMKKLYLFLISLTIIFSSLFCKIINPEKKDKSIYKILGIALILNSNNSIPFNSTATRVYGQKGSFISNSPNNDGISANSLSIPSSVVLDSKGGLYISDYFNNRVLYYPSGNTTATRVYGQGGSFTSNMTNNGGITASSLKLPSGLALDINDGLYIADYGNHRVLYYPTGNITATRVYGQNGSFISNTANNAGISANSLSSPISIALDSNGGLYIADLGNERILYYSSATTTATKVYGQNGNFSSNHNFYDGIEGYEIGFSPIGVEVDSNMNFYVMDLSNTRVLFYPANSTVPTRVYGQNGSFSSNASSVNNGGISADSLNYPREGIKLDSSGGLYISDTDNNRALYYPSGRTTATRVYGQKGNFTTNDKNHGDTFSAATSLRYPRGIAIDSTNRIYIVDGLNNRVLYY